MTDYKALYLKYKKKYLQNKKQYGGGKYTTDAARQIALAKKGLRKSIIKRNDRIKVSQKEIDKNNEKIRTVMLLLTAAGMYLPETDLPGKAINIEPLRGEGVDDVREFLDPMPEWENKAAKKMIKISRDSVRKNSKISKNKPLRSQKKISKKPQKTRRYSTRSQKK